MAKAKNIKKENVEEVQTKVSATAKEVETTSTKEVDMLKEENKNLNEKINNLEELIKKMSESINANMSNNIQNINPSTYVAKMDRPCTLIHLFECYPGLDTTIYVNNAPITFAKFGERRTFRFSDMQAIVSQYRDWFARGILTLGDDCSEFADDFGISVTKMPISQELHKKIASLSMEEFENIIKNLNSNQRILIAKTWIQRCEAKVPGYDNVEKIRILNKYTEGFMSKLLKDLFSSDI